MATCSGKLLSLKTAFLVAITLARRASELAALRSDPSKCILSYFIPRCLLLAEGGIRFSHQSAHCASNIIPFSIRANSVNSIPSMSEEFLTSIFIVPNTFGAHRVSSCVIIDHIKVLLLLRNQYPDGLSSSYNWLTSLLISLYRTD